MEYVTVLEIWFEAENDEEADEIVSELALIVKAQNAVNMVEAGSAEEL